jgi:hypothetical protein
MKNRNYKILLVSSPIKPPFLEYHHIDEAKIDCLGDFGAIDLMPIGENGNINAEFKNNGSKNEDWHGWLKPIFSPIDGIVTEFRQQSSINIPGKLPANNHHLGYVVIMDKSKVFHMFGHIKLSRRIKIGFAINKGQLIGRISNNGYSRCPHLHYGAWKGKSPIVLVIDPITRKLHK